MAIILFLPPSRAHMPLMLSLVDAIGEVDDNSLVNQTTNALLEPLMGRIGIDIVVTILRRGKFGHEAVRDPVL